MIRLLGWSLGLGVLIGLARWLRWYRFWYVDPHYTEQIRCLAPTPDEALRLPPIRPLKAQRDPRALLRGLKRA